MGSSDGIGDAILAQLAATFLNPASALALPALALSLAIAAWHAVPRSHRRLPRVAVLRRALFPRRLRTSATGRADIGWFVFGITLFSLIFGGAIMSGQRVAIGVSRALDSTLGPPAEAWLPGWAIATIASAALFLAYEFGYWLDHWLCHKVPLLWQFHRVHHGAEDLSLLTNFRVHPVDTIVFAAIVSVVVGTVAGLLRHMLGDATPWEIGGRNALTLAAAVAVTQLQHSRLWITFGPRWGRIMLGAAHHQIHHSADPRHHDRNFGSALALWDRVFKTFHQPAERREPITFGLGQDQTHPHGLRAALLDPMIGAACCLTGRAANHSAASAPSRSAAWRAHISA